MKENYFMLSIKRIVVGTDMSPLASWAAARAALLAHESGSESVDLIHVIDNLAIETLRHLMKTPLETERRLMELSRKQLTEIERTLSEKYQIPVSATTLNVGRPYTEIVRYAEFLNADLVVLGAHGGGLVRELFVGSTVDRVLRKLARPVLIVKREPQVPYRKVLIPVDFSEFSGQATEFAMNIAPHASITALHAFEVPFKASLESAGVDDDLVQIYESEVQAQKKKEMEQFISELGAPKATLSSIMELGPASAVIRKNLEVLDPDLIVIGKQGQSGQDETLLGGVTRRLIQEASCDILVVPLF
ncbi:universal stress protein [Nitrosospira multiformis]|jgi:nucleotide-binding universal stress UspA family protein|nr:universal stress protein [Nitrosospira multiformis]